MKLQALQDPMVRNQRTGYIPTLDGWRAAAILAVILYHSHLIATGSRFDVLQVAGQQGVGLFFAISGLLICSRLIDEEDIRGKISLRSFYARRIFRIQPAAFTYLAAIAALAAAAIIPFDKYGWLSAFLSVRNLYRPTVSPAAAVYVAHFWSLAVEEQFYLVLPLLLVLLPKRQRLASFGLIAAASILWTYHATHLPNSVVLGTRTDIVASSLFFPAFLALAIRNAAFRRRAMQLLPGSLTVLLIFAGLMIVFVVLRSHFLGIFVIVCFPLALLATTLNPASWVSQGLEWKPLKFIGRISYSLYLWQQLFCRDIHEFPPAARPLSYLQTAPWSILASFLLAILSFYLIEKPLIRLGHRIFPPTTPGHKDVSAGA